MTSRWVRTLQIVLSVAWAGLGIWSLAKGDDLIGAFFLAFSVGWLLVAAFGDRLETARKRQRARLRT